MTEQDNVFMQMVEFDMGDAKRIQHFTKVYTYASLIGKGEGLDSRQLRILELAAIVHDIGIRPSEEKYGYQNGKLQEEMGPSYARKLLERAGIGEEEIQRVEFLVGHHHTYQNVDASDWQILLEADFIVNSFEEGMPLEKIKNAMEKIFRTKTGKYLCSSMYGL